MMCGKGQENLTQAHKMRQWDLELKGLGAMNKIKTKKNSKPSEAALLIYTEVCNSKCQCPECMPRGLSAPAPKKPAWTTCFAASPTSKVAQKS